MTAQQIALVEQTFAMVQPIAAQAARLFYSRLFQLDPALRPMFRGDMEEQGAKLMHMIALAVGSLRSMDQVLPAVAGLGKRHAAYGVRDEHYATVAEALLWTLEQGLGAAFTPDAREAWTALYTTLATAMQQGVSAAVA